MWHSWGSSAPRPTTLSQLSLSNFPLKLLQPAENPKTGTHCMLWSLILDPDPWSWSLILILILDPWSLILVLDPNLWSWSLILDPGPWPWSLILTLILVLDPDPPCAVGARCGGQCLWAEQHHLCSWDPWTGLLIQKFFGLKECFCSVCGF